MGIAAVLCIAIGVWPQGLYALMPYELDYWPYDAGHVITQLQLLLFATLATLGDRLAAAGSAGSRRLGDGRVSSQLARSWPIGSMAFWAAVVLAALLGFGFLRDLN